eukprot:TRINITY_DN7746_c0_g1_i1.p1 TRINITY_DN7746_c0_g1~~TRINITY_DN7746_c0_g1_i1.p1  ORF type:complete len:114 (-),score=15.83 TRINITY_DN7746_c0_g1_i1:33-374(-)
MVLGPLLASAALAAVAYGGTFAFKAFQRYKGGFPSVSNSVVNKAIDLSGFESPMSRNEAYKILNIRPGVTQQQLKEAHLRLMKLNHPDNGGSTFLATKVNEAKDIISRHEHHR